MKKLLSILAAAALAVSGFAQNVTLTKTQHAASPPDTLVSSAYVINVPTGGIVQATGSGQIISTGGVATSLPWSGLTAIPSPTMTLTGDGATTQTFLAGGGSTSAFTLATVNANTGSWGSATQAPVFTVNGKGLITAAANATVTPVYTNVTGVPTVSLLGNGTGGTVNATAITLGTSLQFATTTSLNTIQGIRTVDSPTFAGLTLTAPLTGANGGTGVANTGKTITLGGNLTTSGAFNTTLTETANTSITLPTTGTLATLAGAEALTNKTYNGNTWTAGTGILTIAAGKTLTQSNTLTYTGTDGSSVNFGTGGTVLYSGGSGFVSSITGTAGQITASAATGSVTLSIPANVYSLTTVGIGTGTTTAATGLQVVDTGTASPRGIINDQYNDGTNSAQINLRKSRGSFASKTTIVTGDILSRLISWGYDGSNFIETGNVRFTSSGTIAATQVPSQFEVWTSTNATPSVLTQRLTVDNAGTTSVLQNSNTSTQQLQVTNSNAGTAAVVGALLTGDSSITTLQQYSHGFTTSGVNIRDTAILYSTAPAGINFDTHSVTGSYTFYVNDVSKFTISSAGAVVASSSGTFTTLTATTAANGLNVGTATNVGGVNVNGSSIAFYGESSGTSTGLRLKSSGGTAQEWIMQPDSGGPGLAFYSVTAGAYKAWLYGTGQFSVLTNIASSSTTTGSIISAGGLGVVGASYTGGDINAQSAINVNTDNKHINFIRSGTSAHSGISWYNTSTETWFLGQREVGATSNLFIYNTNLSANAVQVDRSNSAVSFYSTLDASSGAGAIYTAGGIYSTKAIWGATYLLVGPTASLNTGNAASDNIIVGQQNSGAPIRKALVFNYGGYASPGAFGTNSNGDKLVLFGTDNATTNYDSRIGLGTSGNTWFKSILSTGGGGSFEWYVGTSVGSSALTLSGAGVLSVAATTVSSSTTTGAIVDGGGLGVAGATFIGGNLSSAGANSVFGSGGASPTTGIGLYFNGDPGAFNFISGSAIDWIGHNQVTAKAGTAGEAIGIRVFTNPSSGTQTKLVNLLLSAPSGTVTNTTHLLIGTNTAATSNYGIYDASGYDWYMNGHVGIGTVNAGTSNTQVYVHANTFTAGNTTAYAIDSSSIFGVNVTTKAAGIYSRIETDNVSYTIATAVGVEVDPPLIRAPAVITTAIGLNVNAMTGAGTNYAIKTSTGLVSFGDSVTLTTHTPSSAADTGVAGTVTWDSSFVYVCTATNTWKRVAIASW